MGNECVAEGEGYFLYIITISNKSDITGELPDHPVCENQKCSKKHSSALCMQHGKVFPQKNNSFPLENIPLRPGSDHSFKICGRQKCLRNPCGYLVLYFDKIKVTFDFDCRQNFFKCSHDDDIPINVMIDIVKNQISFVIHDKDVRVNEKIEFVGKVGPFDTKFNVKIPNMKLKGLGSNLLDFKVSNENKKKKKDQKVKKKDHDKLKKLIEDKEKLKDSKKKKEKEKIPFEDISITGPF